MRWGKVRNVAVVFRNAFLLFGGSTTLACSWYAPPAPPPALTVNPTALTFASSSAPAQQVTVSGASSITTNADSPSAGCFSVGSQTSKGSTVTLAISPASGPVGACTLYVIHGSTPIGIPIVTAVQATVGTPVSYEATYVTNGGSTHSVSLTSSNPGVVSVPSTVTPQGLSGQNPYVTFAITPNANGTAVIEVYEASASGPATYSIPVTVGSAVNPTPTPSASPTSAPTASPTTAPTASPTAAPTAGPTATPTAAPTATPTAAPTATPTPFGNSFILTNAATQSFQLIASPVAATVSFFGQVTIQGATSEVVPYSEEVGIPSNGCPITGTVIDSITLTFPTAFTFAPNGSAGPTTGLLDTEFTPSFPVASGYGAIYQVGSCTPAFSAQTELFASPTTYEYVGGGNTTIPAGTYILELWE